MSETKKAQWHVSLLDIADGLHEVGWSGYAAGAKDAGDEALAEVTTLRALVGELVEGLELLDMNATYLKDESEVINGPSDRTYKQFDIASSNAKALIAKGKEQVK